jgi:hypothetical protein
MQDARNSYLKGINQDLNPINAQPEQYYDALNMEVMTDDGLSYGSIVNTKGNRLLFKVPQVNGKQHYVVGMQSFGKEIVLFTTASNNSNGVEKDGAIWLLEFDDTFENIINLNSDFLDVNIHMKYFNDSLNLHTDKKILDIIVDYRDFENCLVYWTDNFNNVRHINIYLTYDELILLSPDKLEFSSDVNFSKIIIDSAESNGFFEAGTVQYAYSLYSDDGFQSIISPLTHNINIYESEPDEIQVYGDAKILGSQKSTVTNKSISLTINDNNNEYNKIKIYRLFYEDFYSDPVISLVYDSSYSNIISFEDDGAISLESLTLSEFLIMSDSNNFRSKTLLSVDRRLLSANITEDYFDINYDARAYRFGLNSNNAQIYNIKNDVSSIVNPYNTASNNWDEIIETSDAVPVNDQYSYKFKRNSNILGGEGPNINYEFDILDLELDTVTNEYFVATAEFGDIYDSYNNLILKNQSYKSYKSPYIANLLKSYQRDETYRFGIVFINNAGAKSFVRWIGDIKMPHISEYDYQTSSNTRFSLTNYNATTKKTNAKVLYLRFNVNNIPLDNNGNPYKYQIVRVKRDRDNKTILEQGLLTQNESRNHPTTGIQYYKPTDIYSTYQASPSLLGPNTAIFNSSGKYQSFISPSSSYFKQDNNYSGLDLNIACELTSGISGTALPVEIYEKYYIKLNNNGIVNSVYNSSDLLNTTISESSLIKANETSILNGIIHNNFSFLTEYGPPNIDMPVVDSFHSTRIFMYLDDDISSLRIPNGLNNALLCNVKKTLSNQYGGNTYSTRSLNAYFPISDISDSSSVSCFKGDVFVNYFNHLYQMRKIDEQNSADTDSTIIPSPGPYPRLAAMVTYYTETDINTSLNSSQMEYQYRALNSGTPWPYAAMQEEAGAYSFKDSVNYTQIDDYYLYNSAYSNEEIDTVYFAKPVNFVEGDLKNKIKASEKQISGSSIDSWITFKTNNFQDVDPNYGEIVKLHSWGDKTLFFQERGFGAIFVNQKSLITDENGIQLALGSGDVLGDYKYISRISGTIHPESVVSTENNFYYFDALNKNIMKYSSAYTGNSNAPLSKIQGINKYIKSLSDKIKIEPRLLNEFNPGSVVRNPRSGALSTKVDNKIYFTFFDGNNSASCINYNEILNSFESTHSFTSPIHNLSNGNLLTLEPINLTSVYTSNGAEYGKFYGDYYESYIEFISNGQNDLNKIYSNIEYLSQVKNSSLENIYNETFNKIRIHNDYQDTGTLNLVFNDNIKRRMRKWRYVIPRSISMNQGDRSDARIRNSYALIKLIYDNNNNKRIQLFDSIIKYNISNEEIKKMSK